jgi:hypothetical protein
MSVHAFYMDDCTLSVPEGFRDRTTNVLEWKTPENDTVVLIVQREPLPRPDPARPFTPEAGLAQYVTAQTKDNASRFAGFRMERDEVAAGDWGFHIHRKAFRWRKDEDVLYHHQAFVLARDRFIVLTGAAKALHRASVDVLLDDVLASFRIRGD